MFSFFKMRPSLPPLEVFSTKVQLYRWLAARLHAEPAACIIYFFRETGVELEQLLQAAGIDHRCLLSAAELRSDFPFGKGPTFVAELHPLNSVFQSAADYLRQAPGVRFLTHLDDPLFEQFGQAKLKELMQRLGMKNDETISHPMVTKAIQKAQQKLESQRARLLEASSAAEWYRLNAKN